MKQTRESLLLFMVLITFSLSLSKPKTSSETNLLERKRTSLDESSSEYENPSEDSEYEYHESDDSDMFLMETRTSIQNYFRENSKDVFAMTLEQVQEQVEKKIPDLDHDLKNNIVEELFQMVRKLDKLPLMSSVRTTAAFHFSWVKTDDKAFIRDMIYLWRKEHLSEKKSEIFKPYQKNYVKPLERLDLVSRGNPGVLTTPDDANKSKLGLYQLRGVYAQDLASLSTTPILRNEFSGPALLSQLKKNDEQLEALDLSPGVFYPAPKRNFLPGDYLQQLWKDTWKVFNNFEVFTVLDYTDKYCIQVGQYLNGLAKQGQWVNLMMGLEPKTYILNRDDQDGHKHLIRNIKSIVNRDMSNHYSLDKPKIAAHALNLNQLILTKVPKNKFPMVVYRSLDFGESKYPLYVQKYLQTGAVIPITQFISTTPNRASYEGHEGWFLLRIELPSGFPQLHNDQEFGDNLHGILLPYTLDKTLESFNYGFRIISVTKQEHHIFDQKPTRGQFRHQARRIVVVRPEYLKNPIPISDPDYKSIKAAIFPTSK